MDILLALLLAGVQTPRPQEPPAPAAPPRLSPGLVLTFHGGAQKADSRIARLAALFVPQGAAPSPFVPPGPVQATLEGFVSVDLGTEVVFSAEGRGSFTLTINGKPALEAPGPDLSTAVGEPFMLRKGRNALVLKYQGPADGDARLRLHWASDEFPREPILPSALSHDAAAAPVQESARRREGRDLLAQRRCLKCHVHEVKGGMPELGLDAPSLEQAGTRLRPSWMAAWIKDPRALRPEATMPIPAGLTETDAADLAAWLATLGPPADAPHGGDAKAGGALFAEMRCVGCHTRPDRDAAAADRIPLRHVRAKWRPSALVAFLLKPDAHYAWIEMPTFGLSEPEARNLAAFLLEASADLAETPAGDAARGKARAEALGCAACHKLPGISAVKAPALAALPADGWSRGCLAAKPDRAPDFGLAPGQKEAIRAFAAAGFDALGRDAAAEFAERQVKALRCFACHKRDDRQDAWSELSEETKDLVPKKKEDEEFAEVEVQVPVVPSLTWAGERLRPEWAEAFIAGRPVERPRPYLGAIRMPAFPARAAGLAAGFAHGHGLPSSSPPAAQPDREAAEIGRRLSGPMGGFDCLSCHAIGPRKATKVFEAPAPNFKLARERLQKDWFLRWVREPLRVEPGTKMPQFFPGGRSQLSEVLDGDAVRQMDALWQYLLEGPSIRPPE
ncbi:MAG TPA: c-type cytochrome [Planctomycetota bacterium]|nr:c-type cytochrome [Planctomycetota bacterium]